MPGDRAAQESDPAKLALQSRAAFWYDKAVGQISGLSSAGLARNTWPSGSRVSRWRCGEQVDRGVDLRVVTL